MLCPACSVILYERVALNRLMSLHRSYPLPSGKLRSNRTKSYSMLVNFVVAVLICYKYT